MVRRFIFLLFAGLFLVPGVSDAQVISGPEVKIAGSDIRVTFSLALDPKGIEEIGSGIDKEFKLYVDLFKVWNVWPDEFVLGKTFVRTIKADPVKHEFVATSFDGSVVIEKRFQSLESMLNWTLSVTDLKLTNTRELQPGQYFIRITAESKIRKLPPVIGYLFLFVSENEFKIKKDSAPFDLQEAK